MLAAHVVAAVLLIATAIAVGWFLPLLGWTLVAFVLVDAVWLLRSPRRI
jgi:hypothetical protein